MKKMVGAPFYQPHGPCVRPSGKAAPVHSITRAEIDQFWRGKKLEEEERQLAAEKEAARIKVKTLKQEDYMLFEQAVNKIIDEENERDKMIREGDITKNSKEAVVTRNIEIRIGIMDWWRKSSHAYLNEPVVISNTDGNSGWKDTTTYGLQKIYFGCCSPRYWDVPSADTKDIVSQTNAF